MKCPIGVLIFEIVPGYPRGDFSIETFSFGEVDLPTAIARADQHMARMTEQRGRRHHAAFYFACPACHASGKMPCNDRCTAPDDGRKHRRFCMRRHPPCRVCGGEGRRTIDFCEGGIGMADKPLSSIVVLYREPDTMTIWGIPYAMRPGQSPRDLLRGDERRRETHEYNARYSDTYRQAHTFRAAKDDWIYLGSEGWYGSMSAERIAEVKAFLAAHEDDVPQYPGEWCPLA